MLNEVCSTIILRTYLDNVFLELLVTGSEELDELDKLRANFVSSISVNMVLMFLLGQIVSIVCALLLAV